MVALVGGFRDALLAGDAPAARIAYDALGKFLDEPLSTAPPRLAR